MSVFQAVNTGLAPEPYNRNGEETTPTTPRPSIASDNHPQPLTRLDDATTPTRATFSALSNQRPLPASPFPAAVSVPETAEAEIKSPVRHDSQRSTKSRDSEDVDMDDSDDGQEGSDEEESINADGTRSTKKKKSQRFWCTDYPPCNLSFTRSEHLARHIRKHTGERPFQCHCSRRFSRLDNLRQHAQTVHVNEEIPNDSLAATGTRFQRQVRTDRVRPPGNRSRASTAGSQTSQGRGHHRNSLSTSSIGSIGSNYSQRDDVRRRPPPLVMASDPRARLPHDNYSMGPDSPGQFQTYRQQSPSGYSTPTSATFSTGQNSPRWASGMQSPISSHSRTASLYAGHRTPGRRLSVPSGASPFQSPHAASFGAQPLTPQNASNSGLFSPTGSIMASPSTATSGFSWSRRDSSSSAADEAWRRRTWHPETYSNFTSRLVNVTTPNYYQPGPAPSNPQNTRLPGIESFDPLPRPATPPHRNPSPMMIDTPSRAPTQTGEQPSHSDDRRNVSRWDMGLHRNLTRLDIAHGTPPMDTASTWASEANRAVQAQAEQARAQPTVRFEQSSYVTREPTNTYQSQHHISAPPITPREEKRRGWYHGPVVVQQDTRRQRTSPEDSSSSEGGVPGTPGSASVTDYNPSIVHSSGWVEPSHRTMHSNPYPTYPPSNTDASYPYNSGPRSMAHNPVHEEPKPDSMLRLEALVAVATSEENATTAY